MFPDTLAPSAGEVMVIAGAVVSATALFTVTETETAEEFPAASLACASRM